MTNWDALAYALPILLGCLISAGVTLLIGEFRAYRLGWKDGHKAGWDERDKLGDSYTATTQLPGFSASGARIYTTE